MEKLIDLLKIIAEKYLIQAMASVALSILGVAFVPNLFGMTQRVGKTLYGVLIFCLAFLLIQGVKYICTVIKHKAVEKSKMRLSDEMEKREAEKREAKKIAGLWDYVDSLKPQDRHYLMEFLKTGNQPIEVMGEAFGNRLLANRSIVACMEQQQECVSMLNRKIELGGRLVFPPQDITYMERSSPTKLYRLKDDYFELLKYSYEKYGKISHFDMEEIHNG